MQTIARSVGRMSARTAAVALRPAVCARLPAVAPARAFSFAPLRMAPAKTFEQVAADVLAEDAEERKKLQPVVLFEDWPKDLPLRVDDCGISWADFRPEHLRKISPTRNAAGDLVGRYEGEDVIFPDLEPTLEWVLTTPVETHLFEEAPVIKCYEEEAADFEREVDE